jgi:hypothetical protein
MPKKKNELGLGLAYPAYTIYVVYHAWRGKVKVADKEMPETMMTHVTHGII